MGIKLRTDNYIFTEADNPETFNRLFLGRTLNIKQHTQKSTLGEGIVKEALKQVDWPSLKAHLEEKGLTEAAFEELCGHIRRCNELICKYPNKGIEKKRFNLFNDLGAFASGVIGGLALKNLQDELDLILQIEEVYRGILDVLKQSEIGKLPAEVQVSALIKRSCHEYKLFSGYLQKSLTAAKQINITQGFTFADADGNPVSMDGVLEGLSDSVSMTVIMEATRNSWFDAEGRVVLPDFPMVGDKERFEAGTTQIAAIAWRNWARVERRRRFLGGAIGYISSDEFPKEWGGQVKALIKYEPSKSSDVEIYDSIANTRLQDRLKQTFMEMLINGLDKKGVGISKGAALPPKELISEEEGHAAVSICEVLGYSIFDDLERPGGLRLIEWIRGYTVLKEVAKDRTKKKATAGDDYAIVLDKSELVSVLQACGLAGDTATLFISNVSLHKSGRDMFDCPLIKLGETKYLLFAPSVIDLNTPMALLSNLSNRSAVLSKKGKAFESSMKTMLKKYGMQVFAFKAKREGQEYEYDIAMPWGDYLFIFECKNMSLSGNDPVQAYYFSLEVASEIRQVKRLAKALVDYPDIIQGNIGPEYVGKKIIPCVLHSLPYSRNDADDGVYFLDASALGRFYSERRFHTIIPYKVGNGTIMHRTALKDVWKAEHPTPEALLEQLKHPFQLELSIKHAELAQHNFPVAQSIIVTTFDVSRRPMTTESLCEALRIDPKSVANEVARVSKMVKAVRKKLDSPNNKKLEDKHKKAKRQRGRKKKKKTNE
jgi:hypothetical protein